MDEPEEPVPLDEDDFDDAGDDFEDTDDFEDGVDPFEDADDEDEAIPPLRMRILDIGDDFEDSDDDESVRQHLLRLNIIQDFEDFGVDRSVHQHLLRLSFLDTLRRGEEVFLDLQDEEWTWEEPVDLSSMKERVLAALEVNRALQFVYVGYRFIRGISEGDQ
jgi:hypothetical protein